MVEAGVGQQRNNLIISGGEWGPDVQTAGRSRHFLLLPVRRFYPERLTPAITIRLLQTKSPQHAGNLERSERWRPGLDRDGQVQNSLFLSVCCLHVLIPLHIQNSFCFTSPPSSCACRSSVSHFDLEKVRVGLSGCRRTWRCHLNR